MMLAIKELDIKHEKHKIRTLKQNNVNQINNKPIEIIEIDDDAMEVEDESFYEN